MNRIAFTLPDVGLREIAGTAHVADGFLILTINDAFLGMADSQRKVIEVAPEAISNARIERRLFRRCLVLEPNSPDLLEHIPGEHLTSVDLRVKRNSWRYLDSLLAEIHALRQTARLASER